MLARSWCGVVLSSPICSKCSSGHLVRAPSRTYSTTDLKRFYKNVLISKAEGGGFEIVLDKHKLRTPMGKLFVVPGEGLAVAVATEWDSQVGVIRRNNMHLTQLSNTALDNPTQRSKETIISGVLELLDTDTICYRVREPTELAELQQKEWDPILNDLRARYGVKVEVTTNLRLPYVHTETKELFRQRLKSFDLWALTGYQQAVEVLKSFLLSTALVDKTISVERAVDLARLELAYQVARWGAVEWHYEVDKLEMRTRLAAAAVFVSLCSSEARTIFSKLNTRLPV